MSTQLYLVVAEDADGNDVDLMVEATGVVDASLVWRHWLLGEMGYAADEIGNPLHIYRVDTALTGTPGALGWNTARMLKVFGRRG